MRRLEGVRHLDAEIEQRFVAGLRRMYPDVRDAEIMAFRVARARQVTIEGWRRPVKGPK